jgi:membrane protein
LSWISERIERALFSVDLGAAPASRRAFWAGVRLTYALGRDLLFGQLSMRAMSLAYTSLLSLVPLLAVSFSVLKGFGVHAQVEPLLAGVLAPLGPGAAEIARQVMGFVDNARAGVLGSLGVAVLLWSVISLLQKIEETLNATWHAAGLRSLGQRFSDYLSVTLVGPVLLFAALAALASALDAPFARALLQLPGVGLVLRSASEAVPLALIFAVFAFLYVFVPNTEVRIRPALAGAALGAGLWLGSGVLFARFIGYATRYDAVYSGFAVVIVGMLWLYVAWLTLLVGASASFYLQHPEYLRSNSMPSLSIRLRERVALAVLYVIARDFDLERPHWTAAALSRWLGIPGDAVADILRGLEESGLLTQTASRPPAFVPALAPERLSLARVLLAVRSAGENGGATEGLPDPAPLLRLREALDEAVAGALADTTLLDLARAPALAVEAGGRARDEAPGR